MSGGGGQILPHPPPPRSRVGKSEPHSRPRVNRIPRKWNSGTYRSREFTHDIIPNNMLDFSERDNCKQRDLSNTQSSGGALWNKNRLRRKQEQKKRRQHLMLPFINKRPQGFQKLSETKHNFTEVEQYFTISFPQPIHPLVLVISVSDLTVAYPHGVYALCKKFNAF